MDAYLYIKTLHIISSTVLFGTGAGIAFFMLSSHFAHNLHERFFAVRMTVLADYIFTLPAVIIQPLTGFWLISNGGYEYTELWLSTTYVLYALAGLCWIPVVWIQISLKNTASKCIANGMPLPDQYHKFFRIWFLLGWPAFGALIAIFLLMVFKPV